MRASLGIVIIVGSLAVFGCSKEVQEAAESLKNLQSVASSADDLAKTTSHLEKLHQQRRDRGDTVSLDPAELAKYLPATIDGYQSGEPATESVNAMEMAYSKATREYTSSKGTVTVSLTDYNSSYAAYTISSAVFALNIKVDNSEETSGTFQTDNPLISGHQTYSKTGHNATVLFGIAGRFWLEIEATNQSSSDWARSIGEKMNLSKLAGM